MLYIENALSVHRVRLINARIIATIEITGGVDFTDTVIQKEI